MTKHSAGITSVFAMGKGNVEGAGETAVISTDSASSASYEGNFLSKATYRVPLNPLLTRGTVSPAIDDFTTLGGLESTGVLTNYASGAPSAGTTKTIVVDTVDATLHFNVGDKLYYSTGSLIGTIDSLTSTQIILKENNLIAIANNHNLQKFYKKIVSYEIHKSDGGGFSNNLISDKYGINQSYDTTTDGSSGSPVQTYTAVNRKYPNNNSGVNSVEEYLSNLQTTKGNTLRIYDINSDTGQRLFTPTTVLDEDVDLTETIIKVDSNSNISVNDIIVINNEEMLVIAKGETDESGSGTTTITVIRGYNDTTPETHKDFTSADVDNVWVKDNIDHLWVLVYADNSKNHHFAKITKILRSDVYGDTFQFEPSLGVDIPKDTKFAIFSSLDSNIPKLDSDNQTLVACSYGLQHTDKDDKRHFINTHVSRPFFYFVNGKDKLEPATRYILRSSTWDGIKHTYTHSVFLTAPEHDGDIVDYSPYTMEGRIVDLLYEGDDPNFFTSEQMTNAGSTMTIDISVSPDVVHLSNVTDASFGSRDNTSRWLTYAGISYYGKTQHSFDIYGITREVRLILANFPAALDGVWSIDADTNPSSVDLPFDNGELSAGTIPTTGYIQTTPTAWDVDKNNLYSVFDDDSRMLSAFRNANRGYRESAADYYTNANGFTRYMHYTDSPLTNNIIPTLLDMISYDSITSSGSYVDLVFANSQKILDKKMKIGDKLEIHQIISNEDMDFERLVELSGTFEYTGTPAGNTIVVKNLNSDEDLRFQLSSPFPSSKTDVGGRYDPLYTGFTINISGTNYHFIPSAIENKSGSTQTITIKYWRKESDKTFVTTSFYTGNVPSFSERAFRHRYAFLVDNLMSSEIPIDSYVNDYSLNYDGSSAAPTNRNLTTFKNLFEDGGNLTVGKTNIEEVSLSRLYDINLVLKGGTLTGHRLLTDYGDNSNKIIKLQNVFKDERFAEIFNKFDWNAYSVGLTNTLHYGFPVDTGNDGASSPLPKYDLNSPAAIGDTHVRSNLSYLNYFSGSYDIEKKIFSGTIDSIEEVVEDGMFKFKVRSRDDASKLLGPVVNKDYKFTDDIVYSTVGPVERAVWCGTAMHHSGESEGTLGSRTQYETYEVGTTTIHVYLDASGASSGDYGTPTITKGDLLFNMEGIMLGRVHAVQQKGTGSTADRLTKLITFEESIPVRIKDGEAIFVTKYGLATVKPSDGSALTTEGLENIEQTYEEFGIRSGRQTKVRGNTVSFAKALSSNPYASTRVNSLLGASDKGIIFTGGNKLSFSDDNAPVFESTSLVGSSSSSHVNAKGYSINSVEKIRNDLPFYCNLSDEISDEYLVDFINLHTVSSLTDFEVVNISSQNKETLIELAPIVPAVLGRVDENALDNSDNSLVETGVIFNTSYKYGYNGPLLTGDETSAIKKLKVNDFIFNADGIPLGKIIDISRSYTTSTVNSLLAITLDRPLKTPVSTGELIYKYYLSSDFTEYYVFNSLSFRNEDNNITEEGYPVSYIYSANDADEAFLRTLKQGMRIEIENASDSSQNGVWTLGLPRHSSNSAAWYIHPRRLDYNNINFGNTSVGIGVFRHQNNQTQGVLAKVLNDKLNQSLYFLNTQGLGSGGVVSLVNSSYGYPNRADDICKPIKWAGGITHYITDNSIAIHDNNRDGTGTRYNPSSSTSAGNYHYFSDYNTRYGNFKWRYFALETGKYLSYYNRRRKDGLIKETYAKEKGRVSGYAKAYRIPDTSFAENEVYIFPYGYYNNEFASGVQLYDHLHKDYVSLYEFIHDGNATLHPYFLETSSIESRDFRPVFGSNFADFTRYSTYLMGHRWSNMWTYGASQKNGWGNYGLEYSMFINPRLMPRLHDNFRGGDWQWDSEAVLNPTSTTYSYPKKITGINFEFDFISDTKYRLHYGKQTVDGVSHESVMDSLVNKWIKIDGMVDKNNNRSFYVESTTNLGGTSEYLKIGDSTYMPPYLNWGSVNGNESFTTGTSLTSHTITGKESITTLYEPWIGPKVDGITRAKDHWELPDPKTLRWFLFSSTDMFPDSMSRKNHIGYSGTVDSTAISRKFTDYNIMLKGNPSKQSSSTSHEYYEGKLLQEIDSDDNYEVLPITEASILPSEMKRFGLMRLVDCVYDWHFNLIDPERLPSDIKSMNTPNFEYTRYLPLKKTSLYVGSGSTSHDDSFTTFACLDDAGSARTPNSGFSFIQQVNATNGSAVIEIKNGSGAVENSDLNVFRIGMEITDAGTPSNLSSNTLINSFNDNDEITMSNTWGGSTGLVNLTFSTASGTTFGSDVVFGDQIFGYDGRYLGRVASIDTSANTITVVNRLERPYSSLDGTTVHYRGPLYVCGDGETAVSSQYNWDSFYHFKTQGRDSNSGVLVDGNTPMNMLQMMASASFYTKRSDDGLGSSWHNVPYGYISSSGNSLTRPKTYYQYNDSADNLNNLITISELGSEIVDSVFNNHFNYDYGVFARSASSGWYGGGGNLTLPPCFRTYYSSLVNENVVNTGLDIRHISAGTYSANSVTTLDIDTGGAITTDLLTRLRKGNPIYDSNSNYIGMISSVVNGIEDATCDLTNADATVTMDSTTGLIVGMQVECSTGGFPSGATVASITNSTTFELSANYTGTTASNQTIKFHAQINLVQANYVALANNADIYSVPDYTSNPFGNNVDTLVQEINPLAKTINAMVGGMAGETYQEDVTATGIGKGGQGLVNKSKKCIVEVTLTHGSASVTCDASNLIRENQRVSVSSDKYGNIPLIELSEGFYVHTLTAGASGDDVEGFDMDDGSGGAKTFSHPSGAGTYTAYMTFYSDEAAGENEVKTTYNHPSNILEMWNSQNPQRSGMTSNCPTYVDWENARNNAINPYNFAKAVVLGTYSVEDSTNFDVPIGGGIQMTLADGHVAHTASKPRHKGANTGIKKTGVQFASGSTGPDYTVKTVDATLHFAPSGDGGISRSSKLYASDGTEANTRFLGNVLEVTSTTIKTDRDTGSTTNSSTNDYCYMASTELDSVDLALEKYGDGFGEFIVDDFGHPNSDSYSFLNVNLNRAGAYAQWNTDRMTKGFPEPFNDSTQYVAKGVYCGFIHRIFFPLGNSAEGFNQLGNKLTAGSTNSLMGGRIDKDNSDNNITINRLTNEIVIRMGNIFGINGSNSTVLPNSWLNFVDLTGYYLVPELGYKVGSKTYSLDNGPFNDTLIYDAGRVSPNDEESRSSSDGGMATSVFDRAGASYRDANMEGIMVDPKYIHYIKDHKRNITGDVTSHEFTLDNIPENKNGDISIFETYRVMRPAEVCFWKKSPKVINLNTVSSQTTKKPQEDNMYGDIPYLGTITSDKESSGIVPYSDDNPMYNWTFFSGQANVDLGVKSMYMAVDMDARNSYYKSIGTIAASLHSSTITGTNFTTNLKVGDVIRVKNQLCYVASIESSTSLTIVDTWRGFDSDTSFSGTGYLWGNYFPVVRDTSYLFNPAGNRNTFKSGEAYNMLLTDGVSKQKMAIEVDADYWDNRALCQLSFSDNFNNDMNGLVSLGEIFSIKANIPSILKDIQSAKIGSTLTIGEEVESVVNDLLSNENIDYKILNKKEYPYYISPNYQGIDVLSAANFAAKYKDKNLRISPSNISLQKMSDDLDLVDVELSYKNSDLRIIEVTRNQSTFDLYNEIIVYGNGFRTIKRNRKSIDEFGKKTLEEVNMELVTQDDVDSRAKLLLSAHSKGDDRLTIKMSNKGIELVKAGDIITVDLPEEGVTKGQFKVYEIRRESSGLIELEIGTYRKDLANRFAELLVFSKANTSSIRGDKFRSGNIPLDFFDTVKLKELRLVIKRIGLADTDPFVLGFQTDATRLLDFGATMGPLETVTEIMTDKDLMI